MTADEPVGIVELRAACRAFEAQHRRLFATLGSWVATTDEPRAQRLFAEACHRHAWHAELWAARTPVIPVDDAGEPAAASLLDDEADDRLGSYRAALDAVASRTASLAARVDGVFDPSTLRVIELTGRDVATLRSRCVELI